LGESSARMRITLRKNFIIVLDNRVNELPQGMVHIGSWNSTKHAVDIGGIALGRVFLVLTDPEDTAHVDTVPVATTILDFNRLVAIEVADHSRQVRDWNYTRHKYTRRQLSRLPPLPS